MSNTAIRDLPYPFHHVVSIGSDVDHLIPRHGALMHSFLGESLGLHIGDSVWPHSTRPGRCSFFVGQHSKNDFPSEVDGHTVFGLLLREWHRGNIDHFHSWTSADTYLLRTDLDPPLSLNEPATVAIPPTTLPVGAAPYDIFRLWFRGLGDGQVEVELVTEEGRHKFLVPIEADKATGAEDGSVYDLAVQRSDLRRGRGFATATAAHLTPRGNVPLGATLVRFELDNFGRTTVVPQANLLRRLGIRPVYVSSHGGRSSTQNFGDVAESLVRDKRQATEARVVVSPEADVTASPFYHADLLHELGVEVIWPQMWERWREASHWYKEAFPPLRRWERTNLYFTSRTKFGALGRDSERAFEPARGGRGRERRRYMRLFVDAVRAHEKLLDPEKLERIFGSGVVRTHGHGSMLGLLLATSMARIDAMLPTVNFWYTHLGTIRHDHEIEPRQVFPLSIEEELFDLARHAYGIEVEEERRTWVPSAGTFLRYQLARLHVSDAVRVEGNRVVVTPKGDEVLGRLWPDVRAGTRDLHGVTVYVPDAQRAQLEVDGRDVLTFTRNEPDHTGRPSITIVDDHAPTVMLDRVPAAELGTVIGRGATLEDLPEPAVDGEAHFVVTSQRRGTAHVTISPASLHLWNTSHLFLRYRVAAGGAAVPWIALRMADGHTVGVAGGETRTRFDAWWTVHDRPDDSGSITNCVATAGLRFRRPPKRPARLPLPLGEVQAVVLGLEGAEPGDKLILDFLTALRPCSDGLGTDDTALLAGRIRGSEGRPVASATVRARWQGDERDVTSDEHGYYYVEGIPLGSLVEVAADVDGQTVTPRCGRWIDLRCHHAEIDIDAS